LVHEEADFWFTEGADFGSRREQISGSRGSRFLVPEGADFWFLREQILLQKAAKSESKYFGLFGSS